LNWRIVPFVDSTPANPWDDELGTVQFKEDPGDFFWWADVSNDDDATVQVRARHPGLATVEVTYDFDARKFSVRRPLSVPQFVKYAFPPTHGGLPFDNDLAAVGPPNSSIGPGATDITAANNLAIRNMVIAAAITEARRIYASAHVNLRFTDTVPS